jgi:uncharacterized protein YegP (UPF0339 family)
VAHHDDDLAEIDLTEEEIDAMMVAGQPVDVVGPPDPGHRPRLELYVDSSRRYGWRLTSSVGEVLVTSGTVFTSKKEARRAADLVMRAAAYAELVDQTVA